MLPWQSPPEVTKVSAFDCTQRFLSHLAAAWHAAHPDAPLGDQQVVLTVPASFDPAARELTRQAAIEAGLPDHFVLLEEPQAAVYRWLASHADDWRSVLSAGDVLLVVDVGGGTTDLTLVTVDEVDGELSLQRLAVGNHLLLGGDNMDLALAHHVATRLQQQGHDLDPWQSVSLWHACRDAKEQLLASEGPDEQTISVLGRGSSLIGGTISTTFDQRRNATPDRRRLLSQMRLDRSTPASSRLRVPRHRLAVRSRPGNHQAGRGLPGRSYRRAGTVERTGTVRWRIAADQNDRADAPVVQRRCLSQRNASASHA